jgi:flagellar biosynthetic protein FliQ
MTPESIITIAQGALMITVMASAPFLGTALAVGLVIGMFQAATQINEMTLSFIPKLLGLVVVVFFLGHWVLSLLINYSLQLYQDIPQLIG